MDCCAQARHGSMPAGAARAAGSDSYGEGAVAEEAGCSLQLKIIVADHCLELGIVNGAILVGVELI